MGGKLLIYSRELDIIDYGDSYTRQLLQHQMQQALVMLSQSSYSLWGKIIADLEAQDMNILKFKSIVVTEILFEQIMQEMNAENLLLLDGLALTIVLQGENAIQKIQSIRSYYVKEYDHEFIATENDRVTSVLMELVFNSNRLSTACFDNSTCCIIKPHALRERLVGRVLDIILSAGFEITAAEALFFDRSKAEEFLEVYKGVIPDYVDQTLQLSSGLCIALELRGQDAVAMFRRLAGPWDVNIAKELFPDSIRGKFGADKVRSVVHCTDLEEDAKLECHYCFRIMV